VEDFPEVEVVEEVAEDPRPVPPRNASRPRPTDEDDVAEVDDAVEVDADEQPQRKKVSGKKTKRQKKQDADALMAIRNRIVGAIGLLGGVAICAIGATKSLPEPVFDRLGDQIWLAPSIFGALMAVVGAYYLISSFWS
jgi:hypothetical protein